MATCIRQGTLYKRHNFDDKGKCKGCHQPKVKHERAEINRRARRKSHANV